MEIKDFKGTKGIFKFRETEKNFLAIDAFDSDNSFYIVFLSNLVNKEEIANAKLFAASKDLLRALIFVTEQLRVFSDLETTNKDTVKDALEQAQKAIKKALN